MSYIGEMVFCKLEYIIKSNYFQNVQKGKWFLDDFEALVRERRFRPLVRQNGLRPHSSSSHFESSEFKNIILHSPSK
jgi:hypothetical protein